jgi:hypothetical protein
VKKNQKSTSTFRPNASLKTNVDRGDEVEALGKEVKGT